MTDLEVKAFVSQHRRALEGAARLGLMPEWLMRQYVETVTLKRIAVEDFRLIAREYNRRQPKPPGYTVIAYDELLRDELPRNDAPLTLDDYIKGSEK
jgi:hypothetical protein